MARLIVLAMAALGVDAAANAAQPSVAACRGVDGAKLCIGLPPGWYGSVAFGYVGRQSAAWMLAGNFRIPGDAAQQQALPSVPEGRVLISVGDFPVDERSAPGATRWTRVSRLRLGPAVREKNVVRNVRFAGRAVRLTVRFGSAPTPRTRALVNERLLALRRVR
jgi:hypothetical protein